MRIIAAAPSEIELAEAAVTVPSGLNAGLNVGILSRFTENGISSVSMTTSDFFVFTVTGTISSRESPSSTAFLAFINERVAKSS